MSKFTKPVLIIEEDLAPFLKRLQKGGMVKGRIVLVLNENHYLLRIFGHNLVMKSNVKFKRFEEVLFKVQEVKPRLKLRLIDPKREFIQGTRVTSKMNLLIE